MQHGYARQAETQLWRFPALGEYTHELEAHGFRVTLARHFDRRTPLQDGDQGFPCALPNEAPEFVGGDHDDLFLAMEGHVLRSLALDTSHQLAESGLGVLKMPVARRPAVRAGPSLAVLG